MKQVPDILDSAPNTLVGRKSLARFFDAQGLEEAEPRVSLPLAAFSGSAKHEILEHLWCFAADRSGRGFHRPLETVLDLPPQASNLRGQEHCANLLDELRQVFGILAGQEPLVDHYKAGTLDVALAGPFVRGGRLFPLLSFVGEQTDDVIAGLLQGGLGQAEAAPVVVFSSLVTEVDIEENQRALVVVEQPFFLGFPLVQSHAAEIEIADVTANPGRVSGRVVQVVPLQQILAELYLLPDRYVRPVILDVLLVVRALREWRQCLQLLALALFVKQRVNGRRWDELVVNDENPFDSQQLQELMKTGLRHRPNRETPR